MKQILLVGIGGYVGSIERDALGSSLHFLRSDQWSGSLLIKLHNLIVLLHPERERTP
jgi:hypothetical protein